MLPQEPVSPEQTDVEDQVSETLIKCHSELWRKWGAMSLYHRKDVSTTGGSYRKIRIFVVFFGVEPEC